MKTVNLQRLEDELAARELEVAIVTSPTNLVYVSGVALEDEETRMWTAGVRNAAVVSQSGETTLIIAESSEHQSRRDSWIEDIRPYAWRPGDPPPVTAIVAAVKDREATNGRIGVEMDYLPVQLYQSLVEALPSATFEDCSEAFAPARSIKTPAEISILRTAIAATERALAAAFTAAHAGDTERDVAMRFIDNVYTQGANAISHVYVYAGDQTTDKFRPPGSTRLESGDLLRVDVGAIFFNGYRSDFARMAIVGKPSQTQRRIYRGLREVHRRMIECVRPGVPAGKLIQVCSEECERQGVPFPGPGILTHSIGVAVHDSPVVYEQTDTSVLEAGMVLAIEPYTVVGAEKYAIEDDVLVTEDGVEVLSDYMDTEEMWRIAD
jgi:Xaa-Pro aminopeptidase